MHSIRMRTVHCSGRRGGGIPACTGRGVYPSMHWAGGVCIPARTGQGGCLPGGGGVCPEVVSATSPACEQNDKLPLKPFLQLQETLVI